jgi:hypothetical protein
MPTPKTCPQCSAPLEVKTVGKFQDKIMACLYCNFKVDIPDEFEVKRAAESKSRDGTTRRVEVTYRRRDLTPGEREKKEVKPTGEKVDAKTFTELAEKYHGPEFAELARQVDFDMYPAKEGAKHTFKKSETVERTAMFIEMSDNADEINSRSYKINSSKIMLYLASTIGFIVFIFWLLS